MANSEIIILAENVELVEYLDDMYPIADNSIISISDPTQTVQVDGLISEAVATAPWYYMRNLFGVWVESGSEDEDLRSLYESRLTPSSMPHD